MEKFGLEYEVLQPLGKGSFAQVVLAKEISTKTLYAVKIFQKSDSTKAINPLSEPAYVVEKRALQAVTQNPHPSLAQLYAAFEDENHVLLVLTYAEGGDMLSWLAKRHTQEASGLPRVSENEIKVLFYQLLSAVSHFHSLGFCHRDVKLENILLDKTGCPVLIDFNLSSTWSPTQALTTHCGSLFYTPPEMFQNKKYVGPEVDAWSLGVVLYSMMFKRFPFMASEGLTEREADMSIARNIVKSTFPLPNATQMYSMEALSLMTSLLVKDGFARPTCSSLLRHPWFNGVKGVNTNQRTPVAPVISNRSYSTSPPKYDNHHISYVADDDEIDIKEVKKGGRGKDDHFIGRKKGGAAERERKMSVSERVAVVKFFCKSITKRIVS